jgi:cytochrome c553
VAREAPLSIRFGAALRTGPEIMMAGRCLRSKVRSGLRAGAMTVALTVGSLIGAAASAQSPPLAANLKDGKIVSYTCLGCHGIVGYRNAFPDYAVPRLRGQSAQYLVSALEEYKAGQRNHPTMRMQASSLSAQQMLDAVTYLAGKPLSAGNAPTTDVKIPQAAMVCTSCHGKDGIGVSPMYPNLAGQHASYIKRALREYQKLERKNPIMDSMAHSLTPAQESVIADYFSSLRPGLKTVPRPMTFLSVKR